MYNSGAEVRAAVMRLIEQDCNDPAGMTAGEVMQLLIRCGASPRYDETGALVDIEGIDFGD